MFLVYIGAWSSIPNSKRVPNSYHQEAEHEPIRIPTMPFTELALVAFVVSESLLLLFANNCVVEAYCPQPLVSLYSSV
jgi:hypothetical protein